jgi:polyphosphate glucokinase
LKKHASLNTLCIDIGATFIKILVLNDQGLPVTEYLREQTPYPATVKNVCNLLSTMIQSITIKFDRVSAGFPGVIIKGIIKTAHNLDPSWLNLNLEKKLCRLTGQPSRVANDADVQGYGDISGIGVELVITLGTGIGSALFLNGQLIPNLELGHAPFRKNNTYEQLLGMDALEKYGKKAWNINLKKAILLFQQIFNYDQLYLGGGYAQTIKFTLPSDVKISKNIEGVLGGIKLWKN